MTCEHAKAWVRRGHSVTWFTAAFKKAPSQEVADGIQYVRKGNQLSVFLHAYIFYKRSNKKFSIIIDEVHGFPFFTSFYVKEPIIVFIHEVAQEIWDSMYVFPFNLLGRFLERIALQRYKSNRFWTDASSTIDDLVRIGIPKRNCVAIPCPISNKPLHIIPKKELDPTFIFVGRLVPMKGIEDVINAFKMIKTAMKNAKLWIVGSGSSEYTRQLDKLIQRDSLSDSIKMWGFVQDDEKFLLMRKAHILLHGSIKEGWGLVVLEAASQATPTIGYNVSGLKETVVDGKTGILVQTRQPRLMAQAAVALFKDKEWYRKMQEKCLVWAGSFRWEDVTKQSEELLEEEVKK